MRLLLMTYLIVASLFTALGQSPSQARSGHTDMVISVCFSPEGKYIVSGSFDNTIKVWNASTGALLETIPVGRLHHPYAVCFRPGSSALVYEVAHDLIFKSLSPTDNQSKWFWNSGRDSTAGVMSLQFVGAGLQVLAGMTDGGWILWRGVVHGKPDPLVLTPYQEGDIEWTPIQTVAGEHGGCMARARPDGGQFAAITLLGGAVTFWKPGQPMPERTIPLPDQLLSSIAYSASGRRLAAASSDMVIEIDTATGDKIRALPVKYGHSVAYCPTADELAFSDQNTVRILDDKSGATRRVLTGHTGTVLAIAYSQDGSWLASASRDHTVRLWDARTGAPIRTFGTPTGLKPGDLTAPKD